MSERYFSDGFAAPIIWGAKQGFSVSEIAEGLGLGVWTICDVIESRSGVRFPRPAVLREAASRRAAEVISARLAEPVRIDPRRKDQPYLAWAHARRGASQALANQGGLYV